MHKTDTSWCLFFNWRMTNLGRTEIQFVTLSCYFSCSVSTPQQATYNLPHLPTLQDRHFVGCILCMTNYNFNFDDFNPDTPITEEIVKQSEFDLKIAEGDAEAFLREKNKMKERLREVLDEKQKFDKVYALQKYGTRMNCIHA